MRYDPRNYNHLNLLREHAILEGDDCPVDDICDSVPAILDHIRYLEEQVRTYKKDKQYLEATVNDLKRKVNNVRSQKERRLRKRGK